MALGRMVKRKTDTSAEGKVVMWLKERYKDYLREVAELMGSGEVSYRVGASLWKDTREQC